MTVLTLPSSYYFAAMLTICGLLFGLVNLKRSWSAPFLAVIVTFLAWYIIEPIYAPETLLEFDYRHIEKAYFAASLFLVAFVTFFFGLRRNFAPSGGTPNISIRDALRARGSISPDRLAIMAIGLWLVLLAIGTARVGGDLFNALFPVNSRSGVQMWQRDAGAGAGPFGFAISMMAYLYTLVLACFGILLPIVRKRSMQVVLALVVLVSWPYAFLLGSRNVALAVVAPMFASIFLFTRLAPFFKVATLVCGFFALEYCFRAVIAMRNVGFSLSGLNNLDGEQHLGLNMGSELIWITSFLDEGRLEPAWGQRYLAEIFAIVPRAVWPGKPLLGIDYAVARGFGGAENDIGVFATISSGMIGQGVLNFGMLFGPMVAALLMALWANWLNRLRMQASVPRLALFLVGLGLTFNLGRDITSLVLFPFIFGYVAVLLFEIKAKNRMGRQMEVVQRSLPDRSVVRQFGKRRR